MQLLLVAATHKEAEPLLARYNYKQHSPGIIAFSSGAHDVTLLTTGVGLVHTTYNVTSYLILKNYDMAINFGVCGSFNKNYVPGTVVNVITDRFADLGVEDGDSFADVFETGIESPTHPFNEMGMLASTLSPEKFRSLPMVSGITVNTVHGNQNSIDAVYNKYNPDIESMEGAAFFYVCAKKQLPAAQIRGVSNMIERRNRAGWKLEQAIENCCEVVRAMIEE